MHLFWLVLFGLIALFWSTYGLKVAYGALRLPWLKDCAPAADAECPRISVLVAARDEEEKLPGALATLVAVDYPNLEIVAVDDRSTDATARILDEFAANHPQLRVVHVDSLPAGWLGKPHALQKAYEASSGEWIVFTDADVHFAPDLLRRAIALAETKGWEHMTLLGRVKMFTVGEKIAMTFFGLAMMVGTRPWRTSDPGSRVYTGVGAFQMIRRSAYEKMGTHRRLAMEVGDEVKRGKLEKEAGCGGGRGA